MSRIVISGLVKSYAAAARRATDDVSLEVAEGEFVVLVGPSGCGKTTLLRMVAGLERPDGGTVHIGERDVTGLPPQRRDVSMVFQSYAIFPHMKVRQNIAFGLTMRKAQASEVNRRVAEAAELLQLNDLLDRYPSQLSGGQRQRVAVARAIVVDAGVLLMDEPLSNLDALLRLQFRAELKKIVRQIGATTLYVTHDQAEAMSLGDRVAVMRDGRIVQAGDPLTVYNHPAHRFVGDFLGAPPMNFFLTEVTDGPRLGIGLPAPAALESLAGGKVLVGIRAENIALAQDGIPATVEVVEPTGASTLLTVATSFGTLKVQAAPTVHAAPDDRVSLHLDPESLRFFDPDTGLALVR